MRHHLMHPRPFKKKTPSADIYSTQFNIAFLFQSIQWFEPKPPKTNKNEHAVTEHTTSRKTEVGMPWVDFLAEASRYDD